MPAGPEAWWADAKKELLSAKTLKRNGHARQAYHHAGQAVEFGLKAIYMRRNGLSDWPEDLRGAAWHDLQRIADAAGLDVDVAKLGKPLSSNWLTVRDWKSNARFPGNAPSTRDLDDFYLAASHKRDGVMGWLESIFHNS